MPIQKTSKFLGLTTAFNRAFNSLKEAEYDVSRRTLMDLDARGYDVSHPPYYKCHRCGGNGFEPESWANEDCGECWGLGILQRDGNSISKKITPEQQKRSELRSQLIKMRMDNQQDTPGYKELFDQYFNKK